MDGVLAIDKPAGITSYDVIREFKHKIKPDYKIGHGGTLDPFASGVLLLLLGKATKKMAELSNLPKSYSAWAVLGYSSDTLDKTGRVDKKLGAEIPERAKVEEMAQKLVGRIEQNVPDYSAAKINGVPRYKLARNGQIIPPKTKEVSIYKLEITHFSQLNERTVVELDTTVSSGTYIRQLSYDLFKSLGCESYLDKLTRTAIGDFSLQKCIKLADLDQEDWRDKVRQI